MSYYIIIPLNSNRLTNHYIYLDIQQIICFDFFQINGTHRVPMGKDTFWWNTSNTDVSWKMNCNWQMKQSDKMLVGLWCICLRNKFRMKSFIDKILYIYEYFNLTGNKLYDKWVLFEQTSLFCVTLLGTVTSLIPTCPQSAVQIIPNKISLWLLIGLFFFRNYIIKNVSNFWTGYTH